MADEKRIAIVPGSFDPITRGHIDIAERAAAEYDLVYLAVMINAEKEYMFTLQQRKSIAEAACRHIKNVRVISSEGYLYELASELSACAIVKGVRNEADREYEQRMAEFNLAHYPAAKTVLLEADSELCDVSSTEVRRMIETDMKGIEKYISDAALTKIKELLSK